MNMTPTNNWICQKGAGEDGRRKGLSYQAGCQHLLLNNITCPSSIGYKVIVSNGEGKMGKRKGFGIPGPGCVWVVERTLPCYSNYMDQGPRSPRD